MQRYEFNDLTQYDPKTKCFRKTYFGCKTCQSIAKISMGAEKISIFEYINQLIISLRLSRL